MINAFMTYFNPYYNQDVTGFFLILIKRLYAFLSGQLPFSELVSDEIQILALSAVAISAALVGVFLILRNITMLANALSHTILIGLVLAYLITMHSATDSLYQPIDTKTMLIAAILTGFMTTFLTEAISQFTKLQQDASIGLVFTTLFALGIIVITLFTRNIHIGTEIVTGNVDAIHLHDLKMLFLILLINLLLFVLFFKEYKLTTFDPGLARTLGVSTIIFNYLLMVQTSLTVIGAFRAVGVLMVLTFVVGPALIARFFTHSLRTLLILSSCIGILSSVLGVATARHVLTVYNVALSTGGLTVCWIVLLFLISIAIAPDRGLIARMRHRYSIKHSLQLDHNK